MGVLVVTSSYALLWLPVDAAPFVGVSRWLCLCFAVPAAIQSIPVQLLLVPCLSLVKLAFMKLQLGFFSSSSLFACQFDADSRPPLAAVHAFFQSYVYWTVHHLDS